MSETEACGHTAWAGQPSMLSAVSWIMKTCKQLEKSLKHQKTSRWKISPAWNLAQTSYFHLNVSFILPWLAITLPQPQGGKIMTIRAFISSGSNPWDGAEGGGMVTSSIGWGDAQSKAVSLDMSWRMVRPLSTWVGMGAVGTMKRLGWALLHCTAEDLIGRTIHVSSSTWVLELRLKFHPGG